MKFASVFVVLGASAIAAASPSARSNLLCGQWSVQHGGPINACGSSYSYTAGDTTACASNQSNCLDICCTPNDPQLCGSWSVENGGPVNSCGAGYTYTATDEQVCASDGSGCQEICCTKQQVVYRRAPAKKQTCGSWSVKHGGPVNACGEGYGYTAKSTTLCNADNSNCQQKCCSPLVYRRSTPTTNSKQTCGSWSVKHGGPVNACGEGHGYTAKSTTLCNADNSNCQQKCCSPLVY